MGLGGRLIKSGHCCKLIVVKVLVLVGCERQIYVVVCGRSVECERMVIVEFVELARFVKRRYRRGQVEQQCVKRQRDKG